MNLLYIIKQRQTNNAMTTKQLINGESQFYYDLIKETNGTNRGYYNLIVTIRDLKLYSVGIIPNRYWKITDVKKYFGIKGNAVTMKAQLEEILEAIKG